MRSQMHSFINLVTEKVAILRLFSVVPNWNALLAYSAIILIFCTRKLDSGELVTMSLHSVTLLHLLQFPVTSSPKQCKI